MKGTIKILEDSCKGCGLCIEACPLKLIGISSKINAFGYKSIEHLDPEGKCTACKMCAIMCPDMAIEVFKLDGTDKKEK